MKIIRTRHSNKQIILQSYKMLRKTNKLAKMMKQMKK